MNQRTDRSAGTAKKRSVLGSAAAFAVAVGLALALMAPAAMAASNPIPGVDIIVRKKPPKTAIVVPVDTSGKFSLRLKEPGTYTISTACRTDGCPAGALSLNVAGKAQKPDADGNASYEFDVGQGGLDLGGQIFVRGAQPIIVNGKSVTPSGVWDDTDIVHGIKIVEIIGNQSPEAGTAPPRVENDEALPGIRGDPIPGTDVGLEHDPEGVMIDPTTTDANGAFQFNKLPPGKYKLTIDDQPPRSVSVDAEGTLGGSVRRGSDGDIEIFDRWGKLLTASAPAGDESPSNDEALAGIAGDPIPGVDYRKHNMGPGPGMRPPPSPRPGIAPAGPGAGRP